MIVFVQILYPVNLHELIKHEKVNYYRSCSLSHPHPHTFFSPPGTCARYYKQCALLLPKSSWSISPGSFAGEKGVKKSLLSSKPSCSVTQIPKQALGIMSLSSFLSFFPFTVNDNGPPRVVHWTHHLLGPGCGFLSHICVDAQCSVDVFEIKQMIEYNTESEL